MSVSSPPQMACHWRTPVLGFVAALVTCYLLVAQIVWLHNPLSGLAQAPASGAVPMLRTPQGTGGGGNQSSAAGEVQQFHVVLKQLAESLKQLAEKDETHRKEMTKLRREYRQDIATLRDEIAHLRQESKEDINHPPPPLSPSPPPQPPPPPPQEDDEANEGVAAGYKETSPLSELVAASLDTGARLCAMNHSVG